MVRHENNGMFYGQLYNQGSQMADFLLSIHIKSVPYELGLTYEELLIDTVILISITVVLQICNVITD